MKKIMMVLVAIVFGVIATSCMRDAHVASHNLSKEADQFKVKRRIVFYNGITDTYMFEMVGYLSIFVDTSERQLEVTVKLGDDKYRKHYLGLSDNVTYMIEQVSDIGVSEYRYDVVFKPQSILPISIDLE